MLYDLLQKNVYGYSGATVSKVFQRSAPEKDNLVKIKLRLAQTDLKRYTDLPSSMSYLIDKVTKSVVQLDQVPQDESGSSLLAETTDPHTGQYSVRFRKGEKNDKDVFIETWSAADQKGFRSSLKVTEKLTKVYNDTVFGGIQWSPDAKKIVFVGENPEVANYKPFFKDPEEPKKEDKDKDKANAEEKKASDAKKAKEHWQDDKFLYQENFGETLDSKKSPAIFIFDLEQNQLN